MSLSAQTIKIVKATCPVVAENGYAITTNMYNRMFKSNPKVKEMFNQTHQIVLPGDNYARQPHALAASIAAYGQNIDSKFYFPLNESSIYI